MTIKREENLREFNFWGGAKTWADLLTWEELDTIEEILTIDNDEMTATEVNDFLWFNTETWLEWIGETEESILERGR